MCPMPRIRAGSIAQHRELVRARLLDAFGTELHDRGFADLTLSHVAERAGIARNTIYNYAADKHELMLDFVDRSVAEFLARTQDQLAGLDSASERLALLVQAQVRAFTVEPGAGSASGLMEGSSLPPDVFAELMNRLSGVHDLVRAVIGEGIATGEFTNPMDLDVLVRMVIGAIGSQRMPVGEGQVDAEQAGRQVTDFVLRALGAR